mmetsp:Transcript_32509/g.81931  ORF Transcript_32509/g.81931 Transcript_32509/m.81931 type:complete len:95 (+) Transcript_32509:232-516(+)
MFDRGGDADEMGNKLPRVDLGTGHTAKSLSGGTKHMCAILDDDSVKCWGHNDNGQLGLGDRFDRGDDEDEMGDKLPRVDLGEERSLMCVLAQLY